MALHFECVLFCVEAAMPLLLSSSSYYRLPHVTDSTEVPDWPEMTVHSKDDDVTFFPSWRTLLCPLQSIFTDSLLLLLPLQSNYFYCTAPPSVLTS